MRKQRLNKSLHSAQQESSTKDAGGTGQLGCKSSKHKSILTYHWSSPEIRDCMLSLWSCQKPLGGTLPSTQSRQNHNCQEDSSIGNNAWVLMLVSIMARGILSLSLSSPPFPFLYFLPFKDLFIYLKGSVAGSGRKSNPPSPEEVSSLDSQ